MRVHEETLVTRNSDPPSNRLDFGKARVVNLEEVLKRRQADARAKAKAERQKPDFIKPRSKHPFVGRVPLVWLLILDEAEAMPALPLLLAIHNQMNVRRKKVVLLTARVWRVAVGRTEGKRKVMLAAIKRVPDLVSLEYRNRRGTKYRASQGPLWNAEYPCPDSEEDDDEM
jgi:hypothetical protein